MSTAPKLIFSIASRSSFMSTPFEYVAECLHVMGLLPVQSFSTVAAESSVFTSFDSVRQLSGLNRQNSPKTPSIPKSHQIPSPPGGSSINRPRLLCARARCASSRKAVLIVHIDSVRIVRLVLSDVDLSCHTRGDMSGVCLSNGQACSGCAESLESAHIWTSIALWGIPILTHNL